MTGWECTGKQKMQKLLENYESYSQALKKIANIYRQIHYLLKLLWSVQGS